MKARILTVLAVILAAVSLNAQITGTASTWNCGRMSVPTYCYGIPVTAAVGDTLESGRIWIDQQQNGSGFIQFAQGFLGLEEASITSPFQPLNTAGGTLEYEFAGPGYTGTLTLIYTAYYSRGGGGRGGAGAGWRWLVTGGTLSVTQSAAMPFVTSPIAPTPTCIPPDGATKCVKNPDPW